MISEEKLDGVEVLTSSNRHEQPVGDCLQHGIHVLVEKTFVRTLAETFETCKRADKENLILMTGFCKRYPTPYSKPDSWL